MSEFTKSKWTVPLYTRRDGNNRCWVMQGKTSICRTFGKPKIAETNAHLIASAPTLKQQRDDLLTAVKATKQRIHFIGLPSEPMNEDGPDWSKEIALIEAAIAKCEE